ncbi:DNA mismatch repair ATPase Mlh1 isoform X2 [Lycorma delicatula]|uniref:DNA mismatch repair ATPase Mlh1 isoform X2 n=1 Tax=Lycorma delicatula TaxID=130591 RepID=UPI003F517526
MALCLDAKATNIQITLKHGGLKILQIQDNGSGIRKEDLGIVCERFTTSKLVQFEDLNSISTFGFRGEALASISHVAHLAIVTKTANEKCAYRALYEDGKLKEPPKACAGNQGTQITVEDLFYNVATRRKSLKNPSEEHNRAVEVVSRYAIHNPKVGFILKKHGESLAEIRTNCNSTHVENIKTIYGNNISRELLEIDSVDDGLRFKLHGFISNVNYSTKKQIFLLFINNRLVDSSGLRKALDSVYSLYLPKGSHPFIYLSLSLDPRCVDVNVHPTKHEVHFLHEDSIIEKVRRTVDCKLNGANSSRVFQTQIKVPVANDLQKSVTKGSVTNPSCMVRTDSNSQKLEKYFTAASSSAPSSHTLLRNKTHLKSNRRNIQLSSVLSLRKEIEEDEHLGLREIFGSMTFVGNVDKSKSLIQHEMNLYICNTKKLAEEMFYQIMLYEFGNFGELKFVNPLPLQQLCKIALDSPGLNLSEEDSNKEEYSLLVSDLLKSKSAMLEDYFSMKIDQDGNLSAIPLLLDNYVPDFGGVPSYILQLARAVNWGNEKQCFQMFCRETAKFYSTVSSSSMEGEDVANEDWPWVIEHVLYSTLRSCFVPPKHFAEDNTVLQIASLPDLYKVFERC